ncbi:MAG TPA: hypothetical protein PKX05_04195, partial [bacterium]|nr:hypothetical protein [bacterium]
YIPIRIDFTVDDSIVAVEAPINLTNTLSVDERMPSFSNTGTKIIYCSDKQRDNGQYEIFTMDINGSGIERVVKSESGEQYMWPVYSPIANEAAGADIVGYVKDSKIMYATLSRVAVAGSPADQNPVTDETDTGISVASGYERFSWGKNRTKGTIVASRTLSETAAPGLPMTYQITVDVDEASVPNGYTINETLSNDVSIDNVYIDGISNPTVYTVYIGVPSSGFKTIRILFMEGLNGGVKDHLIKVIVTTPFQSEIQSITGTINYSMENDVMVSSPISGNDLILLASPYMPIDIYNMFNLSGSDGIIGDFDLLYAINAWARDAQLTGYGIVWPQDIGNWDDILIGHAGNPGIIPIWADTTYHGGYKYNADATTNPAVLYEMYWQPGIFE